MASTIIKEISLDFYNNKIIVVNAKQADSQSRYILVTCTENGKQFELDKNTMSAFIRCHKPDGCYVFNNAEITDDGKAKIELTQQMLAADGQCKVDLTIIKFTNNAESGGVGSSSNIILTDDGNGNVTISNFISSYSEELDTVLLSNEIDENTSAYDVSILSTMTFYINVLDYPMDSDLVLSSNEFGAMMKGVSDMLVVKNDVITVTNEIVGYNNVIKNEEEARQSAEESRVDAENKRQTETENAIKNCENAVNNANEAIIQSNVATDNANLATDRANTAKENADLATNNANIAADKANEAASLCDGVIDKTGFVLTANIANNLTTTNTGMVLDASQGAYLFELINNLPQIHYGTEPPDNSIGKNGDVYMQIVG